MTKTFTENKTLLVLFVKQLQIALPSIIEANSFQHIERHINLLINASFPSPSKQTSILNDLHEQITKETKPLTQKFAERFKAKFEKRANKYFQRLTNPLFPSPEQASFFFEFLAKLLICFLKPSSKASIDKILENYADQLNPFSPEMRNLTNQLTTNLDILSVNLNDELSKTLEKSLDKFEATYSEEKTPLELNQIRRKLIASVLKQFTSEYLKDQILTFALLPNLLILKNLGNEQFFKHLSDSSLNQNEAGGANNPTLGVFSTVLDFLKNLAEEFLLTLCKGLAAELEKDLTTLVTKLVQAIDKILNRYQSLINEIEKAQENTNLANKLVINPKHIKHCESPSKNYPNFDLYCAQLKINLKNTLIEHGGKTYVTDALVNTGLFDLKDFQHSMFQKNATLASARTHSFFGGKARPHSKSVDMLMDEHKLLSNQR